MEVGRDKLGISGKFRGFLPNIRNEPLRKTTGKESYAMVYLQEHTEIVLAEKWRDVYEKTKSDSGWSIGRSEERRVGKEC